MDVDRHLPLKPPVTEILLAVGNGRLHGYAILQTLRERDTIGRIETGPLYRHLKRLLDDGLLRETDEPPAELDDDERRTAYYELTELGRTVLRAEGARLARLLSETKRLGLLGGGAK